MDETINIMDESGDRRYFTIIPNYIINHSTANDQALYLQMKKYAGENGECYVSEKTLKSKLGIGSKALHKSIEYLVSHGWIERLGKKSVMTSGGVQKIMSYRVKDIWKMNNEYYEKGLPKSDPLEAKGCSKVTKGVLKSNKRGALSSNKEEPIIIKTIEEDILYADTSDSTTLTREGLPKSDPLEAETGSADGDTPENNPLSDGLAEAKQASHNRLIAELIKEMEAIDPKNKTYYGNKTQRKAAEFLIQEYGFEEVKKRISILPTTNKMPYFPKINSPYDLKEKWVALEDAVERYKKSQKITKQTPNFII